MLHIYPISDSQYHSSHAVDILLLYYVVEMIYLLHANFQKRTYCITLSLILLLT